MIEPEKQNDLFRHLIRENEGTLTRLRAALAELEARLDNHEERLQGHDDRLTKMEEDGTVSLEERFPRRQWGK